MSANVDLRDHLGQKHDSPRAAVLAAALGYGLDGYDLLILSFALTGIITTFGVSTVEAGSLVTVTLMGAVVGGLVFGPLSDRFGRVRVLTWSVLFFALFTGLSALAQDFAQLSVTRFLAGIGIGGEFGVGMTLAAEAVLPRWRARATAWVAVGFQLGVLAAALLSAPLISWFGWRGLFVVGAAQGLLVFLVRKHVAEPAVFHDHAQKPYAAGHHRRSVRASLATPAARRLAVALVVLTSVQNFGYYGIMTWLPKYLSTRFGLGLVESSVWTAVTVGGMMTGILTFGQVADRVGRRTAFWVFQAGARDVGPGLQPHQRRPVVAAGGLRDGLLRQRHAGWVRRPDRRALRDLGQVDGGERPLQPRTRCWRVRAGRDRRGRKCTRVLVRSFHPVGDLCARVPRHVRHPRTPGRRPDHGGRLRRLTLEELVISSRFRPRPARQNRLMLPVPSTRSSTPASGGGS